MKEVVLAYPPGKVPGSRLKFIVMGFDGNLAEKGALERFQQGCESLGFHFREVAEGLEGRCNDNTEV
jgi:hypothetical protein